MVSFPEPLGWRATFTAPDTHKGKVNKRHPYTISDCQIGKTSKQLMRQFPQSPYRFPTGLEVYPGPKSSILWSLFMSQCLRPHDSDTAGLARPQPRRNQQWQTLTRVVLWAPDRLEGNRAGLRKRSRSPGRRQSLGGAPSRVCAHI